MMEAAVSRLEAVTQRLEAFEVRLSCSQAAVQAVPSLQATRSRNRHRDRPMQARLSSLAPSSRTAPSAAPAPARPAAAAPPAASAAPAGGSGADALAAYRALLTGQLVKALDAAEAVGGQVLAATRVLAAGFEKEAGVIEAIGACRKPSDAELQALVAPVGEQMVAAGDLASGPRRWEGRRVGRQSGAAWRGSLQPAALRSRACSVHQTAPLQLFRPCMPRACARLPCCASTRVAPTQC